MFEVNLGALKGIKIHNFNSAIGLHGNGFDFAQTLAW